ncbi:NAD(P)-binding domain-containing protein [Streptomyces sp. M19]
MARAGHDVMVAKDGSQEKLDAFIEENPRALRGTPAEVAEFGEVVLFSVYWPRLDAVLGPIGPMDGKVVIDTMNPLQVSSDFEHTYDQTFMARSSTSEELQRRLHTHGWSRRLTPCLPTCWTSGAGLRRNPRHPCSSPVTTPRRSREWPYLPRMLAFLRWTLGPWQPHAVLSSSTSWYTFSRITNSTAH